MSKLLFAEAPGNINPPATWETRDICEIMNTCIQSGAIKGWQAHKDVKRYGKYGKQRGWERIGTKIKSGNLVDASVDNFIELPFNDEDLPFD